MLGILSLIWRCEGYEPFNTVLFERYATIIESFLDAGTKLCEKLTRYDIVCISLFGDIMSHGESVSHAA